MSGWINAAILFGSFFFLLLLLIIWIKNQAKKFNEKKYKIDKTSLTYKLGGGIK